MKKLLLGTTVAVFTTMTLAAGVAYAAGGEHQGQRGQCDRPEVTFEMLDADNSGGVIMAEMGAKALEKFAEKDTNGDGFLDAEEVLAAGEARMAERQAERGNRGAGDEGQRAEHRAEMAALMIEHMFERQDANEDGLLSPEEMTPERAGEHFERVDSDGDGEISEAEFEAAKDQRDERAERGRGGKGGHGPRGCDQS